MAIKNKYFISILTVGFALGCCSANAKEYKTYATNNKNYATYKKEPHLYVGIGIGKTVATFGKMGANYTESDAWRAPGAFQKSKFNGDDALNLQLSAGDYITQNTRIEIAYLHYSDLSFRLQSQGAPLDEKVTGYAGTYVFRHVPKIQSDVAMLNMYHYLGTFKIRPYIGAGIGMSQNTVSDYVIFDDGAYTIPEMWGTLQDVNTPIKLSSIAARHKGGSIGDFAYSFELGASYNLTRNCVIDIFGRYVNLGEVKSEGIVSNYYTYTSVSNTIPVGSEFNKGTPAGEATSYYPDWQENGNLSVMDIGLKLRFLF